MTKTYSTRQAAIAVGVCDETLRLWERKGIIPPVKRAARTNARIFTDADIAALRLVRNRVVQPPGQDIQKAVA